MEFSEEAGMSSMGSEEKKDSETELSDLLSCRVRKPGETMKEGDIVLLGNTFYSLGFRTDYEYYFMGREVLKGMTGKVICKIQGR